MDQMTEHKSEAELLKEAQDLGIDLNGFFVGGTFRDGYRTATDEDKQTRAGDYGRAALSGALGIGEGLAAGAEYLTNGAVGDDTRRYLHGKSEDVMSGATPVARRAMNASLLPSKGEESMGDVGYGRSIGMKAAASLPSLAASIFPGWLAARAASGLSLGARAAIGAGTARGTAAGMNAGDVTSQIYSTLDAVPDERLMQVPAFAEKVNSGLSPDEARKSYYREVAGFAPIIAGGISALIAAPEAEIVKTLTGAAAKKGLLKGARDLAIGEAKEEAVESGTGEALTQNALAQQGLSDMDWLKVLSQAGEGALVGGVMGAGSGVVHMGHVAPDQQLAIQTQTGQPQQAVPLGDIPTPQNIIEAKDAAAASIAAQPGAQPTPEPAPAPVATEAAPSIGQYVPPPTIGAALGRVAPSAPSAPSAPEEIGDAGLNRVPPADDPDLIAYDDGTYRPEPSTRVAQPAPEAPPAPAEPAQRPLWPPAEAWSVSPADQAAADDYYAGRDPEPLEAFGVGEDEELEPWYDAEPVAQSVAETAPEAPSAPTAEEDTSEVIPEGVGPSGQKALEVARTTSASKRKTRRGEAALVAGKSREARYAALQEAKPEASQEAQPSEPTVEQRLRDTITALGKLKRELTPNEEGMLNAAIRRLDKLDKEKAAQADAAQTPETKIGADTIRVLSRDNATAPKKSGKSEDRHVATKEKLAEQRLAKAAEDAFGKHVIIEETPAQAAMFRESDPRDMSKPSARTRVKERIQKLLRAVQKAGELPKNASRHTPDHLRYVLAARKALSALNNPEFGNIERDIVDRFLSLDAAARKGDFSLIRETKNEDGGIGTAGMETRAETADEIEGAADEMSEADTARYFRERLLEKVSEQIEESGSVDIEALRKFAKGLDPKLAQRIQTMSASQVRKWASEQEAQNKKSGSLDMEERLQLFGDAIKGELEDQRRNAEGEGFDYDLEALNNVARRADANLAAGTKFKSADDVDAFLQREKVRRERRKVAARPDDEGRRVSVDEDTATSLVNKFEEARKRAEETKKDAPPTYEDYLEAEEAETKAKSLEEKQRETDAAARAIRKKDANKFEGDTLAPDPVLELKQREAAKERRAKRKEEAKKQGWLLSKGAFAQAEQEARELSEGAKADLAEGMAAEEAEPSVFSDGDKTYVKGKNDTVPVAETTTVGDLLDRGFRYGATNPRLTEFVMALIRKNAGSVPVYIVGKGEMQRLMPGADGYYDPAGYIVLPWELTKQDPEIYNRVLIHEAVHAAVQKKIDENPVATAQLTALAEFLKAETDIAEGDYAWTNVQEFVSEVLSRADLQEKLRNTPLTPELAKMLGVRQWRKISLWRALVEKIADWIGYHGPMNALEGVLAAVERADRGDMSVNQEIADYTQQVGWPDPRAKINEPLPSMGAFSKEGVTNAVTDTMETASSKNRRAQLAFKTMDQIRQTFGKLFVDTKGNALDAAVAAMQKIAPYAGKKREAFDKVAQRFITLQRAKPDVVDDLVDLMINATMSNVQLGDGANNDHLKGWHSWQGKIAKAELEAAYNKLKAKSPEAAQLYNDMKELFRDTQNELARSLIAADLADAGVKPPDLEKFIDRVIDNKMSEGDKALFASKPTALKNILDAAQARVTKGDYFPLMRNGNNVIVTINEIKDTMGGVETEKGKVEFRGKTFKEAQAKAVAFAKKAYEDGLPVISVTPTPISTDRDFGVIVHVQRLGFHAFETEGEARRWRRENAGEFDQISEVQKGLETGLNPADLTVAQRNRIFNAIKRQPGIGDDMKDAMGDVFQQVAAGMMSGNRIQKRSITRRKVKGASRDYARNLVQYSEAATTNLARVKFMPEYREAYDRMSALAKDTMHEDAPARVDVLNELSKRFDTGVEKPSEPPRWMQTLMSLTFLGRLASPMHSVINGMQVGMVTYPVLAARFKAARAGQALMQAYGAVGVSDQVMSGLRNTFEAGKKLTSVSLDLEDTGESIKENLASQKDGAELVQLIEMLQERGGMSQGGFELAQSISRGVGKTGMAIAQLDRAARQLPSAVEDINRAVSAVAAYRLARAEGKSEAEARNYAFDVVMNTQGDYSGMNAPRFFNNNYLRPALQFKKYAQMMTVLLADAGYKAVKGASKEERKEAAMFLLNVVGVQIATAGALSLPGIELAKLGFILAAAVGVGDGWDDEEERLTKLAEETFGEDWGRMLTKGVLSRAANIDLSSRVSLSDMWSPQGEPESSKASDVAAYFAKFIGGALYSTVDDIRQGAVDAGNGDWGKALGRVVPIKTIGDAIKAGNAYSEGKATETEVLMNTLGIRSGRQAEEGRKAGTGARESRRHSEEYHDLAQEYLKARNAGERAKVRARIVAHNRQVPLRYRVFPNALDRVRARIDEERVN